MHMKKALLASDDVHTLAWMREAVTRLDLETETTHLGEIKQRMMESAADILVVDAGRAPEVFAATVEQMAAEGSEARLLLVVERDALEGLRVPVRVNADFMVRGGTSEELAARTRALVWPGEEVATQDVIRIDELTINLATYQVHIMGEAVEFTYLEYALFMFLVTHPNRVYSREVLLRRVWGSDYFGGSRTVDVHIRRVRSKLGPELSRRLETVRNVGYLWQN
ncbi:MAG: winged helix-turn-helix transcriptional regulator [Coriobacteriia bacterium]